MPNNRVLRNSCSGGEISRELFGRLDIAKVQSGLDTCRNFIVMPHGVASNRAGFQFVNEVKASANFTRLINFSFSTSQTFAIEMGAGYFRFHTLAASLLTGTLTAYNGVTAYAAGDLCSSGGVNYYCKAPTTGNAPPNATYWYAMPANGLYEIPNSYAQGDLADIHYVQSGDVITLVHPNYAPMELKRFGNLNWVLSTITFASQTVAPVIGTAVKTGTGGTLKDFKYVVTALNSLGYEESPPSAASNILSNDLTIQGNYNTINWSAVTGAVRYNIYKYAGGTYGFIGQTTALTFVDDNIIADLTKTIPIIDAIFNGSGNYPSAVGYYEQRRFFAGTNNQPQNVWATQSASDNNMSYSIPSQASDALRFKIAAQRANGIKHLVPALDLLAMTESTEWRVFSSSGNALTASSITIKAQAQNGATNVTPVLIDNYILYAQAQGGHIREMAFQWQNSGYTSADLCLLAPHLFDFNTITDMTFSRAPTPVMWAINSTGALLGLTYVPDQEVSAWHKHDTTNGLFESCITVTENNADVLYVIVNRTINGQAKRYIECLHTRKFADVKDAFFVDCGLTYSGAATSTISGLGHLEGQTVSILGDGLVMPQQVVTSGAITLPYAVSKAHVGLPIIADVIPPPLYTQQDPTLGQSRIKNIIQAWVRVFNSGIFKVGPNAENLTPVRPAQGFPSPLITDEINITIKPNFNASGQLMIRQSDPLPLTIVDITVEAAIGG
ncbi:MAG: hypothetical protein WC762_03155 [Methylobacter sp.]